MEVPAGAGAVRLAQSERRRPVRRLARQAAFGLYPEAASRRRREGPAGLLLTARLLWRSAAGVGARQGLQPARWVELLVSVRPAGVARRRQRQPPPGRRWGRANAAMLRSA